MAKIAITGEENKVRPAPPQPDRKSLVKGARKDAR